MRDQAEQLRQRIQQSTQQRQTKLVTVTSGKGGVGKSNFSLNFGLGLIERGHKAVLFDVDLGLANLDVLMGLTPKKHLFHLLEPDESIWDIMEKGQASWSLSLEDRALPRSCSWMMTSWSCCLTG